MTIIVFEQKIIWILRFLKILKFSKNSQNSSKICRYLLSGQFFEYNIIKQFCRTDSKKARNGEKSKIGWVVKKQRSIYEDPIFVENFKNSEIDLHDLPVSFNRIKIC